MERTLSIIKPDAIKRNITGKINQIIEENGLKIIAQKRIKLSEDQAKKFYAVHKEKSFFQNLIDYMISEPVVIQVLEGENGYYNLDSKPVTLTSKAQIRKVLDPSIKCHY